MQSHSRRHLAHLRRRVVQQTCNKQVQTRKSCCRLSAEAVHATSPVPLLQWSLSYYILHTHAHIEHPHRAPQADDEAAAGKAKRVKRFSAGLRHSILHGSGLPRSWQRQSSCSAAQRAAATLHGGALSACVGACDDLKHARVPGEMAALVEAALDEAHARTTLSMHAGVAAAEPELGSRAQLPQRLECPHVLSEVEFDGKDSDDEEEEGSLLAFVAALDLNRFAQELGRSDVQASLPEGPAITVHAAANDTNSLAVPGNSNCLAGRQCTACVMHTHVRGDP